MWCMWVICMYISTYMYLTTLGGSALWNTIAIILLYTLFCWSVHTNYVAKLKVSNTFFVRLFLTYIVTPFKLIVPPLGSAWVCLAVVVNTNTTKRLHVKISTLKESPPCLGIPYILICLCSYIDTVLLTLTLTLIKALLYISVSCAIVVSNGLQ